MSRRVLVVDDDTEMRTTLVELLEDAGYTVDEASHGGQALEKLEAGPRPDLIVLDLMMPVMDGWQFRLEQRKHPSLVELPLMVITAGDTGNVQALDADLCLRKPFRLEDLLGGVTHLLSENERVELSQRLAHADRLAALGTISAAVTHEINNPLAVVLANLELLKARLATHGGLSTELTLVREALEATFRIRDIAKDIGGLARSQPQPGGPVDIRLAIDSAILLLGHEITRRGAEITREYGEMPLVTARRERLERVFVNLLANALQALTDSGPSQIRIRTHTDAAGRAVIELTDSGRGIERRDLDRIFEPFFTTKAPGQGTGLGLALCQATIAALGGNIEVESRPGSGSTFRVRLPAASHDPNREP